MSLSRTAISLRGPIELAAGSTQGGVEVRLRPFRAADVPAIVEACRDPLTQRFTVVPIPYDEANAQEFIDLMRQKWQNGEGFGFAISADGAYAGSLDLRGDGDPAEVGYAVAPWARGQGVGTAAVRRLCEWGFAELGLERIEWQANVGNWASRRLAERVGFQYEGQCRQRLIARGVRYDGWIGGLLREDLEGDADTAASTATSLEEQAVAAAIEGELALLSYSVRGSSEALERWLDPEFREIGASGRDWSRPEMIDALLAHALKDADGPGRAPDSIGASEMQGQLLAPDLVQLTYVSDAAGRRARRTSLWRNRDGQWRVLHHQGTLLA